MVKDIVEVLTSLVVVLSLHHECCEEETHLDIHFATTALDRLVKTLLSFNLKTVSEAELSKFFPLLMIVRLVNQVVHEVFLCVLNVSHSVEFKSQTSKLLRC